MEQNMFCYQCQENSRAYRMHKNWAYVEKTPHVAALQGSACLGDERIICSDNADAPGRFKRDR